MPQVVLPIDGTRVTMISTGKVAASHAWADGKRSESQKRDPNTGALVWVVDVVIDNEDDARSATAGVEVQSIDEPKPRKWQPVWFAGLVVTAYVDRAGRIAMRWTAEEIVDGTPAARPVSAAS